MGYNLCGSDDVGMVMRIVDFHWDQEKYSPVTHFATTKFTRSFHIIDLREKEDCREK